MPQTNNNTHPIERLIEVMRALRNPDGGCPWDLEQDFASIAPYMIEEAYEVADAIDRGDMKDLREELGDLLLQPIYHAQMAAEADEFNIYDVINDITEKMISRHPHVFGDCAADSAEDVNAIWDERKKAEKSSSESLMDDVTLGLPALLRAQKLQKKAAKVGFEWQDVESVLVKLEEEIAEMRQALDNKDKDNQIEEFGDMLFVLVNLARVLDFNAEESLRLANEKFVRRFKGMEDDLKSQALDPSSLSLNEWIAIWKEQKRKEKKAA